MNGGCLQLPVPAISDGAPNRNASPETIMPRNSF